MCIVAFPDAVVPGLGTRLASIVPCALYVLPAGPPLVCATVVYDNDPLPNGVNCCPAPNCQVAEPTVTMIPYDCATVEPALLYVAPAVGVPENAKSPVMDLEPEMLMLVAPTLVFDTQIVTADCVQL